MPLFSLFLPSLTTRAAGVNEASVCGSLVVGERNGWAERGGAACLKRRSGPGERGSGEPGEEVCVGGIFPVYLRADVDSVIRKK